MPVDRYPLELMLQTAATATVLSVVIGVWLAWVLKNREFAGKGALNAGLYAAMAVPAPVLCYYLLAVLAHVWPLTRAGLLAAALVSALPLLTRAAGGALLRLDPAYADAARGLGAEEWRVFFRIELPLAFRPFMAATLLVLARLLAEMAVAFWLADPRI